MRQVERENKRDAEGNLINVETEEEGQQEIDRVGQKETKWQIEWEEINNSESLREAEGVRESTREGETEQDGSCPLGSA